MPWSEASVYLKLVYDSSLKITVIRRVWSELTLQAQAYILWFFGSARRSPTLAGRWGHNDRYLVGHLVRSHRLRSLFFCKARICLPLKSTESWQIHTYTEGKTRWRSNRLIEFGIRFINMLQRIKRIFSVAACGRRTLSSFSGPPCKLSHKCSGWQRKPNSVTSLTTVSIGWKAGLSW